MHNANKLYHSANVKHNFNIIIYFLSASSLHSTPTFLFYCATLCTESFRDYNKTFIRFEILREWHEKEAVECNSRSPTILFSYANAKALYGKRWEVKKEALLVLFSIHLDVHFIARKAGWDGGGESGEKNKSLLLPISFCFRFCVVFHYKNK